MKLGYLQIGPPQHGVCRYGRLLAAEAANRSNLDVIEVALELTTDDQRNQEQLIHAAQKLAAADVVHLQYSIKNNKQLWGKGWSQLTHLRLFQKYCSQPLMVTLHDVYDISPNPQNIATYLAHFVPRISPFQRFRKRDSMVSRSLPSLRVNQLIEFIRQYRWRLVGEILKIPSDIAFYWLLQQAQLCCVSSAEEARRLASVSEPNLIQVIPHFVEQRSHMIPQAEARKQLNLDNSKIITILGFIHHRKGHQLLVEALALLPENIKVIFAGGTSSGNENFLQELLALAQQAGVTDRLTITGYLSEETLELHLAATDLAVCPFQSFSASGSLSTWISAARPLLAFALPQITEYNQIVPDAIQTFTPYTATALAAGIMDRFSQENQGEDELVNQLRQQLFLPVIFDRHLAQYHRIAQSLVQTRASSTSSDIIPSH